MYDAMFTRTTMERDKDIAGGIFMCNRTTMPECLSRQLFGLPMADVWFVKRIKAGMPLFLFEYEERRLYGLFKATSDGVINSVPDAFSQAERSYPAQVHVATVWTCHPLSEDEFRGAIEENYYTSHKFNFGLSSEQVERLHGIFFLKIIMNPQNHTSLDFHSRDNYRSGYNNVTRRARSLRCDPTERGLENDMSSESRFGVNYSMYSQNPDLPSRHHNGGIGHRSYPRVPSGIQPQLPNPMHSSSQIYRAPEGSFYIGPRGHHSCHIIPNFEGEQPSNFFDAGQSNLAQELTETQGRYFGSSMYPPPNQDPRTFNLPSSDYLKQDSFYDDKPNLSPRCTDTQVSLHGHTEACQEVDNARGWRYFRLVPANSNLPSGENEKPDVDLVPPEFPSKYSSEPCDYKNYNGAEGDYFSQGKPALPSSGLQSDTFQRRASVFSRLEAPKGTCTRDEVHDVDTSPSADELRLLSQRRDQWNNKGSISKDEDKSMESVNQMEFRTTLEYVFLGETLDYAISLITDTEMSPLEEAPFINFKRRSETRNVSDGAKESDSAEGDMGKCKRRNLIRPSFTDDDPFAQTNGEHQALQNPSQEIVSVKSTGINAEDYGNKGSSALEANSGNREDSGIERAGPVGVSTGTQIVTTDDRNLNSKGNEKDVPVSDTGAETFSVESGVEYEKKSEENS